MKKPKRENRNDGAVVRSSELVRIPVRLKVYDFAMREIETPPIWMEIPEPPPSDSHWDWLSKIQLEAKRMLIADIECRVDWDAVKAERKAHARRSDANRLQQRRSGASLRAASCSDAARKQMLDNAC
jgi:hypothetical protein